MAETKTKYVGFHVAEPVHQTLHRFCEEAGVPVSQAMRDALMAHLPRLLKQAERHQAKVARASVRDGSAR